MPSLASDDSAAEQSAAADRARRTSIAEVRASHADEKTAATLGGSQRSHRKTAIEKLNSVRNWADTASVKRQSVSELHSAIGGEMGRVGPDQLFALLDKDADGTISLPEFEKLHAVTD